MQPRPLFTVIDSFALRGRGTVLVGRRESEVRGIVAVGDQVELRFPDGRVVRSRVSGVECFTGPPTNDPAVGVTLADVIEQVPHGTTVYPAA
jgi:translation elongation factor EF-Tu-like GTPase